MKNNRFLKGTLAILTSLTLVLSTYMTTPAQITRTNDNQETIGHENDIASEDLVYMPVWMQANSAIVYDEELNCTIIRGGALTSEDIEGRSDIAEIGLEDFSEENLACPNTKVEYDLHGFIQNVYYLVPGTTDEYQLSNPRRSRNGTGMLAAGQSTGNYGEYRNYDTDGYSYCSLTRSADGSVMTGTGRITYYGAFEGQVTGDHSNNLVLYDCATKMYVDDVSSDTIIFAQNTYANKSQNYRKEDVGGLSRAILDIWCSNDVYPIKDITTRGTLDNVYSGYIQHRCD